MSVLSKDEFVAQTTALMQQRDVEAAARLASTYAMDPAADGETLAGFCRNLILTQRGELALRLLDEAIAHHPDEPVYQIARIEAHIAHRDAAKARDICDDLLAKHPDNIDYRGCRAIALRALGDVDQAKDDLLRIITSHPNMPSAHFQLSTMHKYTADDPAYQAIVNAETIVDALDDHDRSMIYAALGKALEDTGAYDKAFEAYEKFCAAYREVEPYAEDQWATLTTNMTRIFQTALFESEKGQGRSDVSPVFVFGLPRSGTTLTEQILARHSQANAIGETEVTEQVYGEWLEKWSRPRDGRAANPFSEEALADAGAMYLARSNAYGAGAGSRLIDKSLSSYLYLGFLHYVFPKARFVHCVRDPLDIAVSCFATKFGPGLAWSYDLRDIGRFMRRYQNLMKHWHRQLPHAIHTVAYEDLVADPEPHARALLEFCDLPWEDSCLDTAGTARPIYTASVVQARQPIYKTSMGRAERFDRHLGPLKAALGKAANPDWYKT